MSQIIYLEPPIAQNEPVQTYKPGSKERAELNREIHEALSQQIEVPMVIDGGEVKTEKSISIHPPHNHQHVLGSYYQGDEKHVDDAIKAALKAKPKWENTPWQHRASIFLKAANLISGPYRAKINAATMLGQSKNVHQAEIDSACELIDFLRFNVRYMHRIYSGQPESTKQNWNRLENRPLEGFIFALTPFNFTSIAGNLPSAPAMMGNTIVWKASNAQIYSARIIMEVFRKAGLPDGVINLIFVPGPTAGKIIFSHPLFAGMHYTGSTEVFTTIWKEISNNVNVYKSYPRIVGETGGKNFILIHNSADVREAATAIVRGGFEYQGQKCSAVSRIYVPRSKWDELKTLLIKDIKTITMGGVEDFRNFMNAVINEQAFDYLADHIEKAKNSPDVEVIAGGGYDKSIGYFIEPTLLLTKDPHYVTMEEELFGPVVTVYIYEDHTFDETISLIDTTSAYALTGAIFAKDRYAIDKATRRLVNAAGNFYINDKPTGAVVDQQPFGGSRASGTNDKAGSVLNLYRWVSPRTIKENFLPPTDYRYPFMSEA